MEVLLHESSLLEGAGHEVEQYITSRADGAGLSAIRAGAKAVWNVEATREVARRIQRFKPDVVHVHTPFPLMSPAVFRAAQSAGVPAVTTLHSYRYSCVVGTCLRDGIICEDCVGSRLKLPGVVHACYHDSRAASAALTVGLGLHRAIGTFHKAVARYVTLTDFSRRLLIRDGYPADRIVVKPNSVPDPGYRAVPTNEERRVVFAGRLVEEKGVRTLLNAWTEARVGLHLVIAGDGPLRSLVEEHAAMDDSITLLGWVDERRVIDLMASAEVVLVPSEWYEGAAPLVTLRSLGVGTPVMASDLENLSKEMLDDGAGWVFPPGDSKELAESLRALAADPSRARSLRSRARRSYKNRYSPEVNLLRLQQLYREVVV